MAPERSNNSVEEGVSSIPHVESRSSSASLSSAASTYSQDCNDIDQNEHGSFAHEHKQSEKGLPKIETSASPTLESPPIQTMERPPESSEHRIPSHFLDTNNPSTPNREWSMTSNESLFSIHNMSFTREEFNLLLKSGELGMYGDLLKSGELENMYKAGELPSLKETLKSWKDQMPTTPRDDMHKSGEQITTVYIGVKKDDSKSEVTNINGAKPSMDELPCPSTVSKDTEAYAPSFASQVFTASDGNQKLKGILQSSHSDMVSSGVIQSMGLIQILDYTLNDIPGKPEKYLLVTKCEVVSPALEVEIKSEVKNEDSGVGLKPKQEVEETGILLKPKQEMVAKSAAQIVNEQSGNMAPAGRMAMTRRVHPLASLNPYQGNWTIKVRVTSKGNMRSYRNARGEGNVFNVELTDEDGTQIQATMFNEAAKKFYDKFQVGKVYYISKGSLRVANKQFKTVQNDYEMTLNDNSVVEEASDEGVFIPETKFNFVPIDQLGLYVNGKDIVDVIGVVQSVSPTMSIRRKSNNEMIPKRDITIADESKKTVVVSLWNDLATTMGQELLDMVDQAPVVAIKSVKVGDFQGVSLSTLSKSVVQINPEIPESQKLKSWYDSEGKEAPLASVGAGLSPSPNSGGRSMYTDRVPISHIISNPTLGEEKPAFFSLKSYISLIKPEQSMWYRACKTCNKKVTESIGSGYWCEGCQKNDEECNLRYIMVAKISDASSEAWVSAFNEQAEKIIGCSADELDKMKSQEGEENLYQMKLKEATWVPHHFRVSVVQNEYMHEKRQRITVRAVAPVDPVAETRFLLEEISKMKVSQ